MQALINKQLIAEIAAFCEVDEARAALELTLAKKTAKTLGLPLADTLHTLGLVG